MKFVIMIHAHPQPWGHPTGDYMREFTDLPVEQRSAMNAEWEAFLRELHENGELSGGEALGDPAASHVIRWDGAEHVATDGPYAESKDHFAGFFLIDVASRERAVQIADRFAGPGETVELRPLMRPGGEDV